MAALHFSLRADAPEVTERLRRATLLAAADEFGLVVRGRDQATFTIELTPDEVYAFGRRCGELFQQLSMGSK